ncbi:MAG TPA: hypothetical protein VM388_04415 [Acidimicrobiales bacterium]|nr:hypothetical protein [Acidimicrobiales bacterium]HWI05274.1 hypothetical protein [Acidimicrobiales bacterium]
MAGLTTNFTWDASSGLPLLIDDGTNHYIYGPDGLPLEHIDRNGVKTRLTPGDDADHPPIAASVNSRPTGSLNRSPSEQG